MNTDPEVIDRLRQVLYAMALTFRAERSINRKDGRPYTVEFGTFRLYANQSGEITHFISLQQDISSRDGGPENHELFVMCSMPLMTVC